MDTPRETRRPRPLVKDPLRPKGRSKSAHTFKDSPFYEKFLFFENIKASAAKTRYSFNVGSSCCKFADTSFRDRSQQVCLANHIRGHLSAGYTGSPPGNPPQSTSRRSASSKLNRASKLYFSHGRTSDSSLASSADVQHRYSERSQEQKSSISGSSSFIPDLSSRSWSSSGTRNSSIKPSQIAPADITSEEISVFNYSHELNSSILKKSERQFNSSSTTANSEDTERSSPNTIRHRRPASNSTLNTPLVLPHFLESSVRQGSVTSESSSRLSDDVCMGKSISTTDLSDRALKKGVNLCRSDMSLIEQAVPVKYSSSPPEYPHLDSSKDTFETPVRNISTAKIILKSAVLPKEIADRKITVMETQHCKPYMALDACPRFNDWLSSVMKLQKEHEHTDHWTFPEDEHVASSVSSFSHEPGSPIKTSTHKAASNPDLDLSPTEVMTVSERTTLKHCSTKATNTDVSFASEHVQLDSLIGNCLHISPVSTFPHPDTRSNESEGKYIEYSPSSNRCSYCHTIRTDHGDQENISVNKKTYQPIIQFDNIEKFPKPSSPMYDRSYTHSRKAINRANDATKCSDSDLHGAEIKIQITDEEDPALDGHMALFYPKLCGNRETHGSRHRFRRTSDSTPRMFAPRGVSPHYMFPTSHPTWEDEDVSRYLVSPRNSVGSISSVLSYKSSNADSAVDLGPPDDDQDYEYADFLAQHQARRLSQPNENLSFMEKQAMEDSLTDYQLETYPYAEQSFRCIHRAPITPDRRWGAYCIPKKADYYQLETSNVMMPSYHSQPPSNVMMPSAYSEPSFMAVDAGSCDYRVQANRMRSSLELATRRHSQPEPIRAFHFEDINRSSQHMPLLHSSQHVPLLHRTNPPSNIAIGHNFQDLLYKDAYIFHKSPSILEPHDVPDLPKQPIQTLNMNTFQDQPRHHIIPELIISDHSDIITSEQGSPPPQLGEQGSPPSQLGKQDSPPSQLGNQDIDLESPVPSRPGSSMGSSEHDHLEVEETGFLRSVSMSSLCSIASTCSTCTVMSDSDSQPPTKKQSSWKKIRSFILWSPFIQVFKKHRYPWIQLAGHQGNFHAGEAGSVLKKLDTHEQASFHKLMSDTLKTFVPEYRGDVEKNGETYIQLQDLLCSFSHPCVMDVKMGIRTYLEEELQKARRSPTLRKDMYQKMIEIDCTAPTTEEHDQKAVTKPRYMQWRDEMSSSVELGFRVEGIKKSDGNSSKDFKKTKTRDSIVDILKSFFGTNENIVTKYINRLNEMMRTQETSEFFQSHEVIGSSLLFVHDADENVGVWMIDFGKSEPLPDGVKIDHRSTWLEGNHEDGYLFGLDNLMSVLEEVQRSLTSTSV